MNQAPPLQSLGNLRSAFENARQSSAVESAVQESVAASARMADSIVSSKLQKYGMILFAFVLFAAYMIHRNYKGAVEQISSNIDGIGGDIKKKKDEVEAVARRIDELDLHQGPQGEPGPKGAKGDKGDKGDDGVCPEDCQGMESSGAVDGMSLSTGGVEDFETTNICFHSKGGYESIHDAGSLKSDVNCKDGLLLTGKNMIGLVRGIDVSPASSPAFTWDEKGRKKNFGGDVGDDDEDDEDESDGHSYYNTQVKINIPTSSTSKDYSDLNDHRSSYNKYSALTNYNLLVGGTSGVTNGHFTVDPGYSIGFTSSIAKRELDDKYDNNSSEFTTKEYNGFINTFGDGEVQLKGCQKGVEKWGNCKDADSSSINLTQKGVIVKNASSANSSRVCVSSNTDLTAKDTPYDRDTLCLDQAKGICTYDASGNESCISAGIVKKIESSKEKFEVFLDYIKDKDIDYSASLTEMPKNND